MEAELDHDLKMGLAVWACNTDERGDLVDRRKAANCYSRQPAIAFDNALDVP